MVWLSPEGFFILEDMFLKGEAEFVSFRFVTFPAHLWESSMICLSNTKSALTGKASAEV